MIAAIKYEGKIANGLKEGVVCVFGDNVEDRGEVRTRGRGRRRGVGLLPNLCKTLTMLIIRPTNSPTPSPPLPALPIT